MTIHQIIEAILAELRAAGEKFPEWPDDPLHAAAILGEEVGELVQAINQVIYEPEKSTELDVMAEAIQAGAMAMRFLLSMEDYQYIKSDQHNQVLMGKDNLNNESN